MVMYKHAFRNYIHAFHVYIWISYSHAFLLLSGGKLSFTSIQLITMLKTLLSSSYSSHRIDYCNNSKNYLQCRHHSFSWYLYLFSQHRLTTPSTYWSCFSGGYFQALPFLWQNMVSMLLKELYLLNGHFSWNASLQ